MCTGLAIALRFFDSPTSKPGGTDRVTDTAQSSLAHTAGHKPPVWRNVTFLKWAVQIVVLALVVGAFWFLAKEARQNLVDKNLDPSFNFIEGPANFQPGEGIDTQPDTAGRALWVGMVNTLRIAGLGIVASTILGVMVGLARLSNNWVANKAAGIFIETLRNIPVLVQIILWFAIISQLGKLTPESGKLGGSFFVTKKGISVPRIFLADGFYQWAALMLVFITGLLFTRRKLHAKQDREGGNQRIATKLFVLTIIATVVAVIINPIMSFLGPIFDEISDIWGDIPRGLMQTALSLIAIGGAVEFIRRFLNSRRTPAGLAKLDDDDWFRMIFAGVMALLAVGFFWKAWPGLSSWIIHSGSDFFGVAGDKFGDGRGARPFDAMLPSVTDANITNYAKTGLTMTVGFTALFMGLVFYTASFIAEIVRGGILAVPKGQSEAAAAMGLNRSQALRKVILPQAFRVVMPPLGNQYLNITKNTSLAIAVGLSDVVQVGQSVYNKNNQTLAVFAIWIAFFLSLSLTISFVVNTINRKLAIVER